MRALYLAVAVLGTAITWVQNVQFMSAQGFDLAGFVAAAGANPAAASLSTDLLFVYVACMALIVVEGRRLGMRHLWLYALASTVIALSAGLGLFLFARHGRVGAASGASAA